MAMWQQQMQLMEMFHNDMILMVQMFAAMHRQQLDSVRHEMDMVQRLTGQLQDLQTKLAEPSSPADAGRNARSARPTETHAPVPAPNHKKREKKICLPRTRHRRQSARAGAAPASSRSGTRAPAKPALPGKRRRPSRKAQATATSRRSSRT